MKDTFESLLAQTYSDLRLIGVSPGMDRSAYVVQCFHPTADPNRLLAQLESLKGLLREEVASRIHRRWVPDLRFELVSSDAS